MLEKGLEKKEIFQLLDQKLTKDYHYGCGSILGSMCTEPHEFAKEVYMKYISKNLGDPGLFRGNAELEDETVEEIGELFNGKNIIGTFTTGGSEANLVAMRIAKKLKPNIAHPEIVVPASAHASFDKAKELMGFKIRKAKLKENFELDIDHFASLINENTCGILGIAGTTSLGLIDPIEEIGDLIEGKNIYFHVDAAFGGFIIPFLEKMGHDIPKWDFRVEEVDSITADPHKMGMGIIPSGGIFFKESSILHKAGFEIPYLAGGNFKHFHLVGTRPGATVIAFWALMKHLGMEGFTEVAKKCMEITYYLTKLIGEIDGVKLAADPTMNVVGITTENGQSICEIDEELRKRNWMLGKFTEFNLIRIVLMPHVEKEHLDRFARDLKEVIKQLGFT